MYTTEVGKSLIGKQYVASHSPNTIRTNSTLTDLLVVQSWDNTMSALTSVIASDTNLIGSLEKPPTGTTIALQIEQNSNYSKISNFTPLAKLPTIFDQSKHKNLFIAPNNWEL